MGKANPLFNLSLFTEAGDMPFFRRPLAGPGYIILNVLRIMTIITLGTAAAASAILIIKTQAVTTFFVFEAASHVIVLGICIFLIITELCLFKNYFINNWPLVSSSSSLTILGGAIIAIGVSILGNLNEGEKGGESLDGPYWRLVIAAGIMCWVIGVFNIAANFIFRDSAMGVTAKHVRCDGATAAYSVQNSPTGSVRSQRTAMATPAMKESSDPPAKSFRQTFRRSFSTPIMSRFKHLHLGKEAEDDEEALNGSAGRKKHRASGMPRLPLSISRPLNPNPQFKEHVVPPGSRSPPSPSRYSRVSEDDMSLPRPDDAYHPANRHRSGGYGGFPNKF